MRSIHRTASTARIAAALVALALGVVTTSPTAAALDRASARAADGHRVSVREAGISIEHPRSWTRLPDSLGALKRMKRDLGRQNPRQARALTQQVLSMMSESVRLAVVDLSTGTTLMVFVLDVPFVDDDLGPGFEQQLEAEGIELHEISFPEVAGVAAVRIDVSQEVRALDGTRVEVHATQVLLPSGTGTTLIQLAGPATAEDDARREEILASIRRLRD